jgi:predicted nucleic acid-binding protein
VSLFVDSSAWYAAADTADAWNDRARNVLSAGEPLVTTDHVALETWFLLRHRIHRAAAERFLTGLLGGVARIEFVGAADLDRALEIAREWPDQDFSLADRTSFSAMVRLGLRRVASFDDDFAIYRFGPNRRQAFEVVR